jgi:hypothetical protein
MRRVTALKEAKKMNALTNLIAKFAATGVLFVTMAYGQGAAVKAQIPFDFRTATGTLPAGIYLIRTEASSGGVNITSLRNVATQHTVFAVRASAAYKPSEAGKPYVMFLCGDRGCGLSGIRMGDGTTSYYPNHLSRRDKEVAIIATSVPSVKAD